MNNSQEICNIYLKNGVGFWDYDTINKTFTFSDSFRYLLCFEHDVVTLAEFSAIIPSNYKYIIEEQQRQSRTRELTFPVVVRGGLIWVNATFVVQYIDEYNHEHQSGIIKQVESNSTGEESGSGLRLDLLQKISSLSNLVLNNKSFYDAMHQLSMGISNSIEGMRIGIAQWRGGSSFEIFDTDTNSLVDENYHLLRHGAKIESKWMQMLCENCQIGIIGNIEEFGEEWKEERKRYELNRMVSVLAQPVMTSEGELWGIIIGVRKTPTLWTDFDKKVMMQISNTVSLALKVYRITQKLRDARAVNAIMQDQGLMYIWRWYSTPDFEQKGFFLSEQENVEREFTNKEFRDTLHVNDYNKLMTQIRFILQRKAKKISVRVRSKFKDGKNYRWYQVEGRVTAYYGTGVPRIVVGTLIDIDDSVRENEREKRLQSLQTMIFNRIPIGIEYFDRNGKVVFVNEHLMEMYCLDGQRKQSIDFNLFDNPFFTDEIKQQIKTNQTLDFTVNYDFTEVSKYFETSRTDTAEMNYRISKQYFDGKFHGYLVVVIDTSQEKAKENKLATLESYFDEIGRFAQIGICWLSKDGGGYVSKQWNINFGLHEDSNVVPDLSNYTQTAADDREIINDLYNQLVNKEIPSLQHDIQVFHPDGKLHWINLQLINYNSCGFEGIVGLSLDITQRKDNESMLVEARQKAENLDQIRSQFIANMSHEIRTPLNAIVGFSQLLTEAPADCDERRIYTEIIQTNSDILLKLVSDILDLSKVEAGTVEFQYNIEIIPSICNEIYYSMERRAPKGLQFTLLPRTDYDDLEAYCDKTRVVQIVTNFINNAFKFTKEGRVMLWYKLNAGNIEFHVSDTGIGIEKKNLDRIFEAFVKLDKFAVGTGLGLSICKNMAQQMGGSVGVESSYGKGSHFWLSIPYLTREDVKSIKNIDSRINNFETYMEYQHCISVVEDNPDKLSFIKYSLDGYQITTAPANGFFFFWLGLKSHLTIIDVDSCYGTACYIISSIRHQGDNFKIIAINSINSESTNDDLLKAGANEVIMLPMNNTEFKDRLRKYLSIHGEETFQTFK